LLRARYLVGIFYCLMEYKSKGGSQMKVFDVLEWLAAMCSHVPNKGEQMARYYVYSTASIRALNLYRI